LALTAQFAYALATIAMDMESVSMEHASALTDILVPIVQLRSVPTAALDTESAATERATVRWDSTVWTALSAHAPMLAPQTECAITVFVFATEATQGRTALCEAVPAIAQAMAHATMAHALATPLGKAVPVTTCRAQTTAQLVDIATLAMMENDSASVHKAGRDQIAPRL